MADLTPMMKQYFEIKKQHPECILFFRLGDFYEMFYEDAKLASRLLEITLTGRDCGQKERAPMCGVPYHSADGYIAKLVTNGYSVAICEQVGTITDINGVVKREIVRIITPGTLTDSQALDDRRNNYICCIFKDSEGIGLSFCDISTGELDACTFRDADYGMRAMNEISKYMPSEIIMNSELYNDKEFLKALEQNFTTVCREFYDWCFDKKFALEKMKMQFEGAYLGDYGVSEDDDHVIKSVGALLIYLYDTQKVLLSHISELNYYNQGEYMDIDIFTRRNLELCETLREKEKHGSLIGVLDKTKTSMGARLMRKWIEQPLVNCLVIKKRQNAIAELLKHFDVHGEIFELLSNVFDIERLIGKVVYKNANGRDLVGLKYSFAYLPAIKEQMSKLNCTMIKDLLNEFDTMEDLEELIDCAIVEEPPVTVREGGIIKEGFHEQVDRYRMAIREGKSWVTRVEQEEREKTGIKNLKVGYNKVFGYYIEVSNGQKGNVPSHYIRKQTLANSERYITEELKEIESTILTAQEKIVQLEYEVFCNIRDQIAEAVEEIQMTARTIAVIDVLCALAYVAKHNRYCMPEITTDTIIDIKEGRHPVVEDVNFMDEFVPNDTVMDCKNNMVAVITGPNMAGKSTYMRQVALITLMAQMGSFVPASYAKIGVCDSIFTRVGASDDLAAGESTFMVEMKEVANILNNATQKSLLILDEIGRGTSTYDGLSIAWAVIEYIVKNPKLNARTLFATHYHELTELETQLKGVKNYCVAVKKRGDDITFLRRIMKGGADGSYGIEVAKLAGVPGEVIKRAKQIQKKLEYNDITKGTLALKEKEAEQEAQIGIMQAADELLSKKLMDTDLATLTPIEALNLLYQMQAMIKK